MNTEREVQIMRMSRSAARKERLEWLEGKYSLHVAVKIHECMQKWAFVNAWLDSGLGYAMFVDERFKEYDRSDLTREAFEASRLHWDLDEQVLLYSDGVPRAFAWALPVGGGQ